MRIIHIASEINPYAKTGGLADVAGSLPKTMAEMGHDVTLFMPLYKEVEKKYKPDYVTDMALSTADGVKTVIIKKIVCEKTEIFTIGAHEYFWRDELYDDYEDNPERFSFFCQAVLKYIKQQNMSPDVIHTHDWQTALIPLFMSTDSYFRNTVTMFTIHNISYQGIFPFRKMYSMGLSPEIFTPSGLEFYGNGAMLKAGIIYSDIVNTVSPTYRDETLTEEYGCGMQGLLYEKGSDYVGILNGIDYNEWDPSDDIYIYRKFGKSPLKDKYENKKRLMLEAGLKNTERSLFVCITRLAYQKGIELVISAAEEIARKGHNLIILGSGEKKYEQTLAQIENAFSDNIRVFLKYDFELAHRMYAGGDFFLMPSRFEPCGLSQLISMRYGTLPVARSTGGLADTVLDIDDKGKGNGFVFKGFDDISFQEAVARAIRFYDNDKDMDKKRLEVMKTDYSWKRAAQTYIDHYKKYGRRKG